MIRSVLFVVPLTLLLLAGARAEGETKPQADESTRGGHGGGHHQGVGYSNQYHYNGYHDPYGYTYAGLSFDLSTGLFLALGAIIVLLALAAVIYPLLSKNSGYGDSYGAGWQAAGAGASYGSYRSLNLANLSEKVLSGIERLYETYNKHQ